jgi:hypothetical protein
MLINIPNYVKTAIKTMYMEHQIVLDILYQIILNIKLNPDYHIQANFTSPSNVVFNRTGLRYWRYQPKYYRDSHATTLGTMWCNAWEGNFYLNTKFMVDTHHELQNPNVYDNILKMLKQSYDHDIETAKHKRSELSKIHKEAKRY